MSAGPPYRSQIPRGAVNASIASTRTTTSPLNKIVQRPVPQGEQRHQQQQAGGRQRQIIEQHVDQRLQTGSGGPRSSLRRTVRPRIRCPGVALSAGGAATENGSRNGTNGRIAIAPKPKPRVSSPNSASTHHSTQTSTRSARRRSARRCTAANITPLVRKSADSGVRRIAHGVKCTVFVTRWRRRAEGDCSTVAPAGNEISGMRLNGLPDCPGVMTNRLRSRSDRS